jgi:thiamine-phosphate diphosphorylase
MRFQQTKHSATSFDFLNLYCLTSDSLTISHSEQVNVFCKNGVKLIQLRTKELSKDEFLEQAQISVSTCNAFGAKLIINDNVDIAFKSDAHGVHLGRHDMNPKEARALLGDSKILGTTVHSAAEISPVVVSESDYIGMGPFRHSKTKSNLSPILSNSDFSDMIISVHPIPVFLIGGIVLADMKLNEFLGNAGVAVCSELSCGESLNIDSIINFAKEAKISRNSSVLN